MPLLAQLHESIYSKINNLAKEVIIKYINRDHRTPVLIFFSGDTDKTILHRLGITRRPMLNIINYDYNNDHNFEIQLIDFHTKHLIFSMKTGYLEKTGRMTNLTETHRLMCSKIHQDMTYAHDSRTDVILTKCIFDKIIRKMGIENIKKYLDSQNN